MVNTSHKTTNQSVQLRQHLYRHLLISDNSNEITGMGVTTGQETQRDRGNLRNKMAFFKAFFRPILGMLKDLRKNLPNHPILIF